jgi:hypothetical protein
MVYCSFKPAVFTLKDQFNRENTNFKEGDNTPGKLIFCTGLFLELIKAVIDEKEMLREMKEHLQGRF